MCHVVGIDAYRRAKIVQSGPTILVNCEARECPSCREHAVRYDTSSGEWYCRQCGEDGAAGTYWAAMIEAHGGSSR